MSVRILKPVFGVVLVIAGEALLRVFPGTLLALVGGVLGVTGGVLVFLWAISAIRSRRS